MYCGFFSSFLITEVYCKCCLTFGLPFNSAFLSIITSYPDLLFLKAALLFCRARAIRFRQDNNEAVGGFFSQIGQLYMVHHLWGKFVYTLFFLTEPAPNRLLTLPRRQGFCTRQRNVLDCFCFTSTVLISFIFV